MRHYVIASHGKFAEGIYQSIKIIAGEQQNVHIINAFLESDDIEGMADKVLSEIPAADDVIICTDILGGSVNTEFMKRLNKSNYYLISGMNLPLLMQLFLSSEENTEKMIREIVNDKQTAPVFCNDLAKHNADEEGDF
jgi:fructoselysine and glucoselysine-specific PTS system IIA component